MAGIAAVALVSAAIILTAHLGIPLFLCAVAIGSTFVINKATNDYQNGQVSSIFDYLITGAYGGLVGSLYVGGAISTWWKTGSILKTVGTMLSGGGTATLVDYLTQRAIIRFTDLQDEIDYFSLWSSFLGGSFAGSSTDRAVQIVFAGVKALAESRSNNDECGLSLINAIASGILAAPFGEGALNVVEDVVIKDIAQALFNGAGIGTFLGKAMGTIISDVYSNKVHREIFFTSIKESMLFWLRCHNSIWFIPGFDCHEYIKLTPPQTRGETCYI